MCASGGELVSRTLYSSVLQTGHGVWRREYTVYNMKPTLDDTCEIVRRVSRSWRQSDWNAALLAAWPREDLSLSMHRSP